MSDNYDSGFELVLSDAEKDQLVKEFYDNFLPEFETETEDDLWYAIQIGDRMFDLNIWIDDMDEQLRCAVYECYKMNDNWHMSCKHTWMLTEENEDA